MKTYSLDRLVELACRFTELVNIKKRDLLTQEQIDSYDYSDPSYSYSSGYRDGFEPFLELFEELNGRDEEET